MSRFFVPRDAVRDDKIVVSGPEAHHIINVMRLKSGDEVTTFDGSGREYIGKITAVDKRSLTINVSESRIAPVKRNISVTLCQAIPKKDKMDYIIEKATELGVNSIIPIETARSVVRLDDKKAGSRVERWRRIAKEAAKQSGAQVIPDIEDISDFDGMIPRMGDYGLKVMACLDEKRESLKEALRGGKAKNMLIFIGPEGDFTKGEIAKARSGGARLVSLGAAVLKSDTAGLAALAMINYEYEN